VVVHVVDHLEALRRELDALAPLHLTRSDDPGIG
jgi:hypothetical protein